MQHRRRQSIFQACQRAFNAHHPKPEQRAKPVQAVSGREHGFCHARRHAANIISNQTACAKCRRFDVYSEEKANFIIFIPQVWVYRPKAAKPRASAHAV